MQFKLPQHLSLPSSYLLASGAHIGCYFPEVSLACLECSPHSGSVEYTAIIIGTLSRYSWNAPSWKMPALLSTSCTCAHQHFISVVFVDCLSQPLNAIEVANISFPATSGPWPLMHQMSELMKSRKRQCCVDRKTKASDYLLIWQK